jgi:hypothetical protein
MRLGLMPIAGLKRRFAAGGARVSLEPDWSTVRLTSSSSTCVSWLLSRSWDR